MIKTYGKIKYIVVGLAFAIAFHPNSIQKDTDTIQNNELILLWQDDVSTDDKHALLSSYEPTYEVTKEFDNFMLLTLPDSDTAKRLRQYLEQEQLISAVDYNAEVELCYSEDPYSQTQWALDNPGYYSQLVGENLVQVSSSKDVDMNVPESWGIYNKENVNTREVVVAVIDTGVDANHPDLMDSMWVNPDEIPGDGIDNDKNGYVDDIFGWDFYNNDNTVCHYEMDVETEEISASKDDRDDHGTHCAGIIAATANNNIGIAGVASNVDVKIMSLKIHGGPNGKGSIADAILAVKYAASMGADVVNMSWGTPTYNKTLEQVIKESSMLFVTAAGNTGNDNDKSPIYPANFDLPNVISVTFINQYGTLTGNSNYGKKTVDIAAPGMDILSTVVGSYGTMSGSSMAAPQVSGIAAILYSASKHISPQSVKQLITSSAKALPSLKGSITTPGIPDAYSMIVSIGKLVVDTTPPTLDINTYYEKEKIVLGIYGRDEGGSTVRTIRYLQGKHTAATFKNGVGGTAITSNTLELNKAGTYTFYISDYSGNETIVVYDVLDDLEAPLLSSDYHYSLNGEEITIDLKVIDELSGVKSFRYSKGKRDSEDFASGWLGTSLTLKNNKNTLRLTEPGDYTFYVCDYRGNKAVYHLSIANNPITSISTATNSVFMNVGDLNKLKIYYSPQNTTDKIYYTSSNPSIASISQWGAIHAKSQGRCVITIKSTSGTVKKILVTVK